MTFFLLLAVSFGLVILIVAVFLVPDTANECVGEQDTETLGAGLEVFFTATSTVESPSIMSFVMHLIIKPC